MKSEPDVFSIYDLKAKQHTFWDGVRNYQARNHMVQGMKVGDLVLFYHSNAKPSGVAGLAIVSGAARSDEYALDKKSHYHDPKSSNSNPRWFGVDLKFVAEFSKLVSLEEIKQHPKLKKMVLVNNSRLSVQPVAEMEFQIICSLHTENKKNEIEITI